MSDIIVLEDYDFKQNMLQQHNNNNSGSDIQIHNLDFYEMKYAWLQKIYNSPEQMVHYLVVSER
jgi:hypothetical protein